MVTRNGKRISLRRYIVPLGLVCCCLFLVSASSAKMINNDLVAKESEVYVAGWSVSARALSDDDLALDAGGNAQSYSLVVENNSDVVSTYSIKISSIPVGVKIGLDIMSESDLAAPVNGEVIFTNTGGDLGCTTPGNTRMHVLTLKADSTADVTSDGVDLAIDVLFAQKDPRL